MATGLDIRFWTDDQLYMDEKFSRMVELVSKWPQIIDDWQELQIVDKNIQNVVLNITDPLSSDDIQQVVRGYNSSTYHLVTGRGFKCWRFKGLQAIPGFLRVQVESWGRDYARRHGRDYRIEGDAALSIQKVGPYCVLLNSTDLPSVQEVNHKVEENLEKLTDLLFSIIDGIKPNSMKVFVDEADYLPFNAHMAYYRDEDLIIKDIELIDEVYQKGMPSYRIKPLKVIDPAGGETALHPWRNEQARRTLQQRLAASLPKLPGVTKESIRHVISSGEFDNYTMPIGVTILEYPDFMNALLDRFYLAVLNASNG
jgi:hypothetical protein